MIKFVGCLFSNDMHVFVDMFVQGIPKIRHGKSGRQAHRNSFRWGPLYSDIGLEQLEAVNGMGCLGGYMGAYGMHRYVEKNHGLGLMLRNGYCNSMLLVFGSRLLTS